MNKKETAEIKKLMKPSNCVLTQLRGCYVNENREIISTSKHKFLRLPEEDMVDYLDLFKKMLSGKLEKNLLNLSYPLKEHASQDMDELLNSNLDDDILEKFYDRIVNSYYCETSYYIITAEGIYDIPGKDEDVYHFIISVICPIIEDKNALEFHSKEKEFKSRKKNIILGQPMHGFLFPSFTDRTSNINEALFYTKKSHDVDPEFIRGVLGADAPRTFEENQELFMQLIPEDTPAESVQQLIDTVTVEMETNPEHMVSPELIKKAFQDADIPISKNFNESIPASAITGSLKIKTNNATIDTEEPIELKEINGRRYLLVPVDSSVEINGVVVTGKCQD